jgi:hypothetical protein
MLELDSIDKQIIGEMSNNAHQTSIEIAKKNQFKLRYCPKKA